MPTEQTRGATEHDADVVAWEVLHALRPQLLALAQRQGLGREDAEDVVSEAVLRALAKADLDASRARSWLHVVTRNLAMDLHRRRPTARTLGRLRSQVVDEPDIADGVVERLDAQLVAGLLDALPERQRAVLLQVMDGHGTAEVADRLAWSYKATESLLSRGRRTLREALTTAGALVGALVALGRRTGREVPLQVALAGLVVVSLPLAAGSLPPPDSAAVGAPRRGAAGTPAGQAPAVLPAARTAAADRAVLAPVEPATTATAPRRPVVRVGPAPVPGLTSGPLEVERHDDGRGLLGSVLDCVAGGLEVSTGNVGCRRAAAQPAARRDSAHASTSAAAAAGGTAGPVAGS